jgi:non-ribosomal peptide synthetase-like protein
LSKKETNNKPLIDSFIEGIQLDSYISSVVILLSKYSSFLSETITLNIWLDGNEKMSRKEVFNISGLQTFSGLRNDVHIKFKNVLNQSDKKINSFNIEWFTDNESTGTYLIAITETDGINKISFNCKSGAFFETVFKKATQHFFTILNKTNDNPEILLNEINYILPEETNEIQLYANAKTDDIVGKEQLLHSLFENNVSLYDSGSAVHFNNIKLTYDELNKKANRLAYFFIENGVKPGNFIGVHLKRSPEVYIAMLGILKAGAAYVPIDSGYPEDRVHYILEDAGVKFLVSQSSLKDFHTNFDGKILYIENELNSILTKNSRENNPEIEIPYSSPAYIIYTSGSTGRPKGVVIPHASASNLVKAEKEIFKLNPNEKVAQGFSVAFDASVEEIWLAFASGSTLFPVNEDIMHSGSDLSDFIDQNSISVLSTVPTMLFMMKPPLPSLKLLILGGENCPHELLLNWHRETLRIVNTYGPTEATVIATYADFKPDEKITIGRPVINYAVYITDNSQNLVPNGVPGELCIAGKGLATGYLKQEELTLQKFIQPKLKINPDFPNRIYRTGDLARFNEKGQIEFLGRIDSQVKLRGYRIELSEIESQLMLFENIKNAVVAVKEDTFKVQRLIAYVLLKDTTLALKEEACKDFLKTKLASYMVPTVFVAVDHFPVLPSGKTDRKKLPEPVFEIKHNNRKIIEPTGNLQKAIHGIWQKYFSSQEISVTDDFFDLGGHSLLASLVISDLRKIKEFQRISVQDVYTFRTIEKLSQHIEHTHSDGIFTSKQKPKKEIKTTTTPVFNLVVFLQTLSFFLFILVSSTGLLSPFVIERIYPEITPYWQITLSSIFVISTFPALIIVSIIVKWLVIGKFKEGSHPLWGWYYFRFWLVKKFVDMTPLGLLSGTPFLNLYFRLMGAKIGKNAYLGSDRIRIFDLLEIGENSSISREAHLTGYTVENGQLIIGPISIGKNCFVGTRSVVSEYSVMNDNSTLGDLSLLPSGDGIPEGENWEGSPAKKTDNSKFDKLFTKEKKGMPFFLYLGVQFFAILFLLLFPLVLMVPFGFTLYEIDLNYGFHYALFLTIPCAAVYVVLFCVLIAFIKWIIIGKAKEADFSVYSFRYVQKWTVDMIMHFVLLSFKSIYATIYLPSWLRLMGAKIGWRAEISTVNQISTDLLDIGEGSFLADSVSIGSPVVRNGVMFLRKTSIGSKTFIGNSAVLACGDSIGNNSLIGVLSVAPINISSEKNNNASWLGSPSMYLPQRQASQDFPSELTFNPTKILVAKRGIIEFFKITLPLAFSISLLAIFYKLIYDVLLIESFFYVILIAPLLLFGLMLLTPFITAAFKWTLIGKCKPSNKPLWSVFVWKNEFINSLCESMVYPMLVNMFLGTPYAPCFFRLMGSKIGKKVFMDTTEITEFDLVHIEDNVCLNQLATIQTHLFEDRVMKMSDLYIKKNCSLGAMSVVLYDSVMEENSSIDALSLVMKGESIPSNTKWAGSPAKFVH